MTGQELKSIYEFENNLTPGNNVMLYWTNCYDDYATVAVVVRVNAYSIVGALKTAYGPYPAGHKINVPRITDLKRYSGRNRAKPF